MGLLPGERLDLLSNQDAPRVAMFSLGGTIAMTTQADGTVAPALSAD